MTHIRVFPSPVVLFLFTFAMSLFYLGLSLPPFFSRLFSQSNTVSPLIFTISLSVIMMFSCNSSVHIVKDLFVYSLASLESLVQFIFLSLFLAFSLSIHLSLTLLFLFSYFISCVPFAYTALSLFISVGISISMFFFVTVFAFSLSLTSSISLLRPLFLYLSLVF